MKINVFRAVYTALFASAIAVSAAENIDVTSGWLVQPLAVDAKASVKECPKADENAAAWKADASLRGSVPLAQGVKNEGNSVNTSYNAWYKKSIDIPAEWKGRSVVFAQELNYIDEVVYVNGKKAGTVFRPYGEIEIGHLLKYGAANEIRIFASNRYYGTGQTHLGYFGRDEGLNRMAHFTSAAKLTARSDSYIDDVYTDPSVAEKKLTVRCEIESVSGADADIAVEVSEDAGRDPATKELRQGKIVKNASVKAKLKKGSNVVNIEIPWTDAVTWEINRPFLYNCKVTMKARGADCDAPGKFIFGFREIRRVGKEFIMNGRVQRFRGFWNMGVPKDLASIKKYGYTLSYETHKHNSVMREDAGNLENYSRAGVAVFKGMPTIYYIHDAIRTDPEAEAQYRNHFKFWVRSMRNYPCVIAASCGVNQICPEENMKPDILGQIPGEGGVVLNIERACALAREYHPNCLYFSHADGTNGDISSNNLYFNFTPLQEREEWLLSWSKKGIMPWYAAEFGAPYYACWFHARVPEMTEWLAVYYGEKAYEAESEDMLRYSGTFAVDCQSKVHGGWVNGKELYDFNPLGMEYKKMLVYRTNRAWRKYGQNGGLMYLQGWSWGDNPMLNCHRQANCDLVTFLGGAPDFADRTHAYYSGTEIKKNLVFVWDGFGKRTVTADWKFTDASGKTIASGKESVTLAQSESAEKTITVNAPKVSKVTPYRFEVAFNAEGIDDSVSSDSFPVEVYPAADDRVQVKAGTLALFDPSGKSADVLTKLGIEFTKVDTIAAALNNADVTHLVIGRFALDKSDLDIAADRIAAGLRVLVLPQNADIWESLGFIAEDCMAREMHNVSLPGIDDTMLSHWALAPEFESSYGIVMKHETRRGPRWTHRHAIAGLALRIPQRAGFIPLVRGEFDMSYTALLKNSYGKGSVTFCSFDFEGRAGVCPAATKVAASVFRNFTSDKSEFSAKVVYDGNAAGRLVKSLGLDATAYKKGNKLESAVLLVSGDSSLAYADITKAVGKNSHALVFANDRIAGEAGLSPAKETEQKIEKNVTNTVDKAIYRVTDFGGFVKFPFAGVNRPLLRWRDALYASKLTAANGFTVAGNGLFAISGDGKILFDQIDPLQIPDRYSKSGRENILLRNAVQSSENNMRRIALILANWMVCPGKDLVARSLYTKPATAYEPISSYNVLGPFPSKQDDSAFMVETVFDKLGEQMAIDGDMNPNPRFHPEGLIYPEGYEFDFVDWRPVVKSEPNGFVNIRTVKLFESQSFCTSYCVGFVDRESDGVVTLRFGVDWRAKIWVNGKEVFKTYGGGKDEGAFIIENVQLHKGRNVFTFKIGSGQAANAFYANITKEIKAGDLVRRSIPELDAVRLYETMNDKFDPYEYFYW